MRLTTTMGLTAIALIECFTPALHAQTAPPAAPQAGAAAAVIQAQLAAPGPTGKIGGAEADAIHKHYIEGIGRRMAVTNEVGSSSSSGSGTSNSGSQSGGY